MNYDVAKELKEARFPQDGFGQWDEGFDFVEGGSIKRVGPKVYLPTLSELIEACGEDFECLDRLDDERWKWAANSNSMRFVDKTPEEAVARLWLALNPRV